jgi:cyclopropane-fatty-acyl-phospholipid synthase
VLPTHEGGDSLLLQHLFSRLIRQDALVVIGAGGKATKFGDGKANFIIRFTDPWAEWQLLLNPDLMLGELYMDGRLRLEKGDIAALLALLMRGLDEAGPGEWHGLGRTLRTALRKFHQFNPVRRAKAHVAHHYDLSSRLYDLFLDADRQYSCAYFLRSTDSLEQAQSNKKLHIMSKLRLDRPGLRVLDIGCGWGGLGLDLGRKGCSVVGITLSEEQIMVARRRAAKALLADNVHFELADYRELTGRYDRIVSVGMFEHVGVAYYDAFFAQAAKLLADDGVMLLHTIGRCDGPGSTNPWIAKYIFPGGYVPALSEVTAAIERNGLIVCDVEVLRLHYALTLAEWRRRFLARREEAARLYDERFCRMWEFYLAGSEMAFRHDGEVVFQIQISKRLDTLPITRDYMRDEERGNLPAALLQAAQ